MKRKQLLLVETPIPVTHIKLGSLISKPWSPIQDAFLPPSLLKERDPLLVENIDFFTAPRDGFNNLVCKYGKTALSPHLTRVLGITFLRERKDIEILQALAGKEYQLMHPETWFTEELCRRNETKAWLEAKMSKEDVFLVVGFRTFTDARVQRVSTEERETGVGLTIPVVAVAGATVAGGIPVQLDSGLTISQQSQQSGTTEFSAPGEQVYAVQVRRVTFKWFSRTKVNTAFLAPKNRWVSVNILRGTGEEENDTVEADIAGPLRLAVEDRVMDEGQEDEYLVRMK